MVLARAPHRILVVDDEPDSTSLVVYHLARAGHRVSTAALPDALRTVRDEHPDVVVLDISQAGAAGYDLVIQLRADEDTKPIGIVLLTSRRDQADRVRGLGADDYLTKPFSPQELTLRVNALLRRLTAPTGAQSVMTAGPITLDRSSRRVTVAGRELKLTATEYRLLHLLLDRRGRVQSRPELLESVWDAQPDIQTRTVDMHVQRLRSKLGEAGRMIETVRGFGYRFKGPGRGRRAT